MTTSSKCHQSAFFAAVTDSDPACWRGLLEIREENSGSTPFCQERALARCKVSGAAADYDCLPPKKAAVMSAVIDASVSSDPLRAGRALRWCVDSFRLWWRAPWKLLVLAVAIFVVEGLLQLVPRVGVTLSKIAVPMLTLGFILGLMHWCAAAACDGPAC